MARRVPTSRRLQSSPPAPAVPRRRSRRLFCNEGGTRMRFHSVVAGYALWILSTFVVFYLVHGKSETALQLAVLCGAIPAALQILFLGVDLRGLVAPVKIWLALLAVILFSYFINMME